MIEQLTFLEETPQEKIDKRLDALEERLGKTMRSQYAKISDLTKKCMEYQYELEMLKSAMARCGLKISMNGETSFYTIEKKIM